MEKGEKSRLVLNLEYLIGRAKTSPYAIEQELKKRGVKGVTQPTIHRILSGESNDPRTSSLRPLAEYFGVSVSDLRDRELFAPPQSELRSSDSPKDEGGKREDFDPMQAFTEITAIYMGGPVDLQKDILQAARARLTAEKSTSGGRRASVRNIARVGDKTQE